MRMWKWLAATLVVVLAACGGGGDAPPSNELRIGTISPASINAVFPGGGSNRRVTLNAGYSGQLTGSIGVVIEDPDAVFDAAFVRIGAASTVDLDLYVSDTAPVGRHTRPLVIHVCTDLACTRELSGFPRTIPKDVTITGTTLGTSSLQFTSTAGVAPAYQFVTATPPNGVDYTIDQNHVITYFAPDGSDSLTTVGSIFYIVKNATGFAVVPRATFPGRYTGRIPVVTPGHGTVYVDVNYVVGPAVGPVVTLLTPPSASVTGLSGTSTDIAIEIDVVRNLRPVDSSLVSIEHPAGTSPTTELWLRYYESSEFTPTGGPAGSGLRLRVMANACFLGTQCLSPGTYTATVVYSANAYGQSTAVRVPVTFTVNPALQPPPVNPSGNP